MSKSKKFKPVLKPSEIRCGVTYLRVVVNDEGVVYLSIYKPTCDPYVVPCDWQKSGKSLMVDYTTSTFGFNTHHFKDNYVSDMMGIYDGRRHTNCFYDLKSSTNVVLHSTGLFKFSNKLLQKLQSFGDDPIKVYEFLNPEMFFTASKRFAVLNDIKNNNLRSLKEHLIEKTDYKNTNIISQMKVILPKNNYIKLR